MKLKTLICISFLFLSPLAGAYDNTPPNKNAAPWVGSSLKDAPCMGNEQGFGPFDYTRRASIDPYNLTIVEHEHFTRDVENLVRDHTSSTPEGDLAYTLTAWPNHHRALLSIIRFQVLIQKKLVRGQLITPPECYLQRAIHFSPHDAASYSLYAYYLGKMQRFQDAVKMYEKALTVAPENAKIAYSFSLLLIDLKRYEEAVKYANIAYQDKHAPSGLKQKLEKLGVWHK
jgi:tetratricopeptide (TPR) repeat protein